MSDMSGLLELQEGVKAQLELEKATPWELFHRLWSKAVDVKGYVKAEWQLLEKVIPGPATYDKSRGDAS